MNARRSLGFLLAALAPIAVVRAQFERPDEHVQQLADEIAKELQQIDQLLLQSSGGLDKTSEAMGDAARRMGELLDQTAQSQDSASKRMDELITALQKMARQSQSSPDGDGEATQIPPPPSGQQGQQPRSQRQELETPEMQQHPGAPEQQPPGGERDQQKRGEKKAADKEYKDPTEQVEHQNESGKWGNLPDYMEFVKTRGGQPEVPERYRKYRDAFQKQSQHKPTREGDGK